jgi:hypothetical protein
VKWKKEATVSPHNPPPITGLPLYTTHPTHTPITQPVKPQSAAKENTVISGKYTEYKTLGTCFSMT